jgi:hypothetical protein
MEGLSGAVPFEEIEVKNRTFYRYRRYEQIGRRFRRRMGLMVFPKIAVSKNFLDNLFFLDKRDDSHFAATVRSQVAMQSYSRLLIGVYIRS